MPKKSGQLRSRGAWLLCLAAAAGAISCTSPLSESDGFRFATQITDSGVKLFQVSDLRPFIDADPSRRTRPGRETNPERSARQQLERAVKRYIAQSGYCRSGFVVLGRHSGETVRRIRGECREPASASDRDRFPNTIDQW